MMKSILLQFVLILACTPGVSDGQGNHGAGPKKPRTPDDYQPRTLREIAAASAAEGSRDQDAAEVLLGNLLPSRVRVVYKGSARPLPQSRKDFILRWARRYAGDPTHYTAPYETEMLFHEEGTEHWLAVNKRLLPRFEKELKEGAVIDLYVIRLGGIRTAGRWEWALLVETFARTETAPRQ